MSRITRHHPARTGTRLGAGVLAGLALAAAPALPTPAAAAPTVLDASAPVDAAGVAGTAAWLRGLDEPDRDGDVARTALVVLDPGTATPRTLDVPVPRDADHLDLGTEEDGRVVAYVSAPRGIYRVPLDGSGGAERIDGSSPWAAATSYRGAVAWVRSAGGKQRVYTAARFGATAREAFRLPSSVGFSGFALARNGTVAVHAGKAVDVGPADFLWRARAGYATKRLLTQSTGGASENGMGNPTTTTDGTRMHASRWNSGGGHPTDLTSFSVASGRKLTSRPTEDLNPNEYGDGPFDVLQLDAGRRVITAEDVRLDD